MINLGEKKSIKKVFGKAMEIGTPAHEDLERKSMK